MSTDFFDSLLTFSQIAQELSISINQTVSDGEAIFKRLRDKDVELIVVPTPSEHIFFFVKLPVGSKQYKTIFAQLQETPDGLFGGPFSVNRTKLQNWLNIPFIWLNSFIHFSQSYGSSTDTLSGMLDHREVVIMSKLAVLIAIEATPKTEQLITGLRYIYMELAKGKDVINSINFKGKIEHLKITIRSRLQSCIINKILRSLDLMVKNPPICVPVEMFSNTEGELSGDNWNGFINPFTGSELHTFEAVLDVMYLAYGCNKDTTAANSRGIDLVKKIIEETSNYKSCPNCNDGSCADENCKEKYYAGIKDPLEHTSDWDPHMWSMSYVKEASAALCIHLRARYGEAWQSNLESGILTDLLTTASSIRLATLKASANLPQSNTSTMSFKQADTIIKVVNKELRNHVKRERMP